MKPNKETKKENKETLLKAIQKAHDKYYCKKEPYDPIKYTEFIADEVVNTFKAPDSKAEEELKKLRNYCTLTFGISHPEIYKCEHEVKAEALVEVLESFFDDTNNGDIPPSLGWVDKAKQALTQYKGE